MWYNEREEEGAEAPFLLLLFLRPLGFALMYRTYYQADGGDDCKSSFREVFDYLTYVGIHPVSSFPLM